MKLVQVLLLVLQSYRVVDAGVVGTASQTAPFSPPQPPRSKNPADLYPNSNPRDSFMARGRSKMPAVLSSSPPSSQQQQPFSNDLFAESHPQRQYNYHEYGENEDDGFDCRLPSPAVPASTTPVPPAHGEAVATVLLAASRTTPATGTLTNVTAKPALPPVYVTSPPPPACLFVARKHLMHNIIGASRYDAQVSPAGLGREANVTLNSKVISVEGVRDNEKRVSMVMLIHMRWYDRRLEWTQARYANVSSIELAREDRIWTPHLDMLEWSMIHRGDMLRYTTLVVTADGAVDMRGFIVDEINCMKWSAHKYPFDRQVCDLTLRSRDSLFNGGAPRREYDNVDEPSVSGDWVEEQLVVEDMKLKKGSMRRYRLTLVRVPDKHIFIWILPANLLAIVSLLGAYVGCDSTERFSFGSTIMVSLVLLLIGVKGEIPVKSQKFPILGTYYVGLFIIVCVAITVSRLPQTIARRWFEQKRHKKEQLQALKHGRPSTDNENEPNFCARLLSILSCGALDRFFGRGETATTGDQRAGKRSPRTAHKNRGGASSITGHRLALAATESTDGYIVGGAAGGGGNFQSNPLHFNHRTQSRTSPIESMTAELAPMSFKSSNINTSYGILRSNADDVYRNNGCNRVKTGDAAESCHCTNIDPHNTTEEATSDASSSTATQQQAAQRNLRLNGILPTSVAAHNNAHQQTQLPVRPVRRINGRRRSPAAMANNEQTQQRRGIEDTACFVLNDVEDHDDEESDEQQHKPTAPHFKTHLNRSSSGGLNNFSSPVDNQHRPLSLQTSLSLCQRPQCVGCSNAVELDKLRLWICYSFLFVFLCAYGCLNFWAFREWMRPDAEGDANTSKT